MAGISSDSGVNKYCFNNFLLSAQSKYSNSYAIECWFLIVSTDLKNNNNRFVQYFYALVIFYGCAPHVKTVIHGEIYNM